MARWPWRRERPPDPLGSGLWRRLYDDCVTAARHAEALTPLMGHVREMAEQGEHRWPSDSLDVPADPDGRAYYLRLRDVQRACAEAAYRSRLSSVTGVAAGQDVLLDDALRRARSLLAS